MKKFILAIAMISLVISILTTFGCKQKQVAENVQTEEQATPAQTEMQGEVKPEAAPEVQTGTKTEEAK